MKRNPLLQLKDLGQSVWLDFIRRGMLLPGGQLVHLIADDGLGGVTSNPAIFEKAIGGSHDYDEAVRVLARRGKTAREIYETLTVEDIQKACDLFSTVFEQTRGKEGFVSLEVSPELAHDDRMTVLEAKNFWKAVGRNNVFIKVPATEQGLKAIRGLIAEGINVNITLLFGLPRYREVTDAYLGGLEDRIKAKQSIGGIHSVASFFLSRIDVLIDPMLAEIISAGGPDAEAAKSLQGEAAIASAKIAYEIYKVIFSSKRFRSLASNLARPQRLLWASTGTKNPKYSDVKYIEPLIGRDTINTMPLETINAYRDHGNPASRLEADLDKAHGVLGKLEQIGIHMDDVTQQLENEAVEKFSKPYASLLATLEKAKLEAMMAT